MQVQVSEHLCVLCFYYLILCICAVYGPSFLVFGAFVYACMCVCDVCVCEGSRFCIFVGGVLTAGSSSVPAAGNVSLPGSWQTDDIIDFVQYLGVR